MSEPYIGEIRPWATTFTPQGWLLCNGDRIPIMTYQVLYAVIGDLYGPSDHRTYFSLPSLLGAAPMHWGTPPVDGWPYPDFPEIGHAYGTDAVVATLSNFAPHTHVVSMAGASPKVAMESAPSAKVVPFRPYNTASKSTYYGWSTATPDAAQTMADGVISQVGNNIPTPHENRQPFQAFRFCINWDGIFPAVE